MEELPVLPRGGGDHAHGRREDMEIRVCLSKAMAMGFSEGRSLCLRLVVEDLADGLAAEKRSYSFAEAVRRKPLEESASGWTASVVSWESRKSVSSFKFPILFSSPRSVGEQWGRLALIPLPSTCRGLLVT